MLFIQILFFYGVRAIKSFNKQTQNLVLFFFFSIMVEPQNNPIIINVFPLTHLGFLLTKRHHYNDHFSVLIYVPNLGTLLILHQDCSFIVSNFIFFLQFSQESTWTRNYHVGLNHLTINGLTWWQQSWALLAWYYYNLCRLLHGEKNMGIAPNTP